MQSIVPSPLRSAAVASARTKVRVSAPRAASPPDFGQSTTVSNYRVDVIYDIARSARAVGGKLMGAGGGGFLVLFVPPHRHQAVRKRPNRLIKVPFKLEFSGSQIIFYDQQEDYSAEERARASQSIESFRELVKDPV